MSKVQLQGNVSGTGVFTIASPNSNTDRTQTLPDNSGTLINTGSTGVVTQAMLASNIATSGPTFRVWSSVNQTITGATSTIITFNQEDWDTNNNFSSNTFTPTVAGYYFINAGIRTNNAGGSEFVCYIVKNGNTYAHGSNNASTGINLSTVSNLVYMNGSTDYVRIEVYPGPTTCTTVNSSAYVYFTGFLARTA
jgi:hypothetical protein